MIEFKLFVPTKDDVDEIMGLMYPRYFEESVFKTLTYDPVSTRATLEEWLSDVIIAAKVDGKIVGFGVVAFMQSFYKEKEADIQFFFILPEYRGTGISRALCDALVQNSELNGAKVIYTSSLSGMGEKNDSLYINLWKKFGFEILGTVMIRS